MASHLLILSDRDALAWVLRGQHMAFSKRWERELTAVAVGDTFLLYSTRGCFHNPTRDRGRVFGHARVTTPVTALGARTVVAGREFELGCRFELVGLAPRGHGVELAPLIPRLGAFPNKRAWSARMRRPLLTLPSGDAQWIQLELSKVACDPSARLADYA